MSYTHGNFSSSSAALRGPSMENLMSNFTVKTKIELYPAKKATRRIPLLATSCSGTSAPPILTKRRRYRKQYPGEQKGITEEMRFVAMRLRNVKGKKVVKSSSDVDDDSEDDDGVVEESSTGEGDGGEETWQPSIEGFVKYLVDSKLVFDTIERIVDESSDVSYAYFRKTGLERSEALAQDLEWFRQQDIVIPPPSNPGLSYAKHIEELAVKSAPIFLCHFYNIYFAHIAGGQLISKQVCDKLLEGRELEFNRFEGNAEELLKVVRENLNMLAEHWSRDEKNKCLRDATKSFRGRILPQLIPILKETVYRYMKSHPSGYFAALRLWTGRKVLSIFKHNISSCNKSRRSVSPKSDLNSPPSKQRQLVISESSTSLGTNGTSDV